MSYLLILPTICIPIFIFFSFEIINLTDFLLESLSFTLITGIVVFGRKTLDITITLGLLCILIREFFECLEQAAELQHILHDSAFLEIFVGDILSISGLILATFGVHKMFVHQNRIAEIEPLTNTFNKRAIESLSKTELSRAKRNKANTSLILIDIDYFKSVNDNYGHQVGDKALIAVADHLRKQVRSYDLLSRWGGDEFIILCPNTNKTEVIEVMTRLQKPVSFELETTHVDVTLSIGATTIDHTGKAEFNALFVEADKALYFVKQSGRNNRCHFDSLSFD
ncbi:hypothetical protein A9264_14540 [Vibrio sp. UCD-FRSSP16_10]|uniref:GGDEF domain-containing protein n=1 Tax=unclassified Vibrio TaxID=2614977 RepID=UPI0007FEA259|nr:MULTISPECIES: GGDEF domain-containing protein [unclassified Vibrio]OBT13180.1 hypothetical protein A9260_14920 [Vibrio sp. UCD-FRSSP16_30]OBT19581.1 hypothetical protein A9264_14540 [Vibrio sp. UCD-FRSSP16_10]